MYDPAEESRSSARRAMARAAIIHSNDTGPVPPGIRLRAPSPTDPSTIPDPAPEPAPPVTWSTKYLSSNTATNGNNALMISTMMLSVVSLAELSERRPRVRLIMFLPGCIQL